VNTPRARSSDTTLKPSRPAASRPGTMQPKPPPRARSSARSPVSASVTAVAFFAERLAQEAPQLAVVFDEEDLHGAKPTAQRPARECELREKALRNRPGASPARRARTTSAP